MCFNFKEHTKMRIDIIGLFKHKKLDKGFSRVAIWNYHLSFS